MASTLSNLNLAITRNDGKAFDSLLKICAQNGVKLELDKDGYSPLHVAVIHRRTKMLEQLLEQRRALGLNVEARSAVDKESWTAWEYATKGNFRDGIILLVKADCSTVGHQAFSMATLEKGKCLPSKVCEKAVISIFERITIEFNPSTIMPSLFQSGVLTSEDLKEIMAQQNTRDKTMLLFTKLPGKGEDTYQLLFLALKSDTEHRPHPSLGKDLEEISQKFLEQEQKERYEKAKHTRARKGSQTTPTTLEFPFASERSSFNPDSGFLSNTHTPLEPESEAAAAQQGTGEGARSISRAPGESSNFDNPRVLGHHQRLSPRKPNPVISVVTRRKKPSTQFPKDKEGRDAVNRRLGGNIPKLAPRLSIVREDDFQGGDSYVERDNAWKELTATSSKHYSVDLDERRKLEQIVASSSPISPACPSVPISIPTRKPTPDLKSPSSNGGSSGSDSTSSLRPRTSSSSSPSSISSPLSSDTDSGGTGAGAGGGGLAAAPKVLHYKPTKLEMLKNFFTNSIQDEQFHEALSKKPSMTVGVKIF